MDTFRIALANIRFPATPEESVSLAEQAIAQASADHADLICFPECFVSGYRAIGKSVPPPDPVFLERAWSVIRAAAAKANLAVVLGTERVVGDALLATALVVNRDGTIAGFQDKVQLDPSEEGTYSFGSGRRVFQAGRLTFGIAICHESAGPFGAARKSSSTLISTRPSSAVSCLRVSPILRTHFMRRQSCAALPRTLATSQP